MFSCAVWKVVCGRFDGALAKELFAESTGARLRSAPPCDARVSARLALMSELGGPTLAALELPSENPQEAEPMCVS